MKFPWICSVPITVLPFCPTRTRACTATHICFMGTGVFAQSTIAITSRNTRLSVFSTGTRLASTQPRAFTQRRKAYKRAAVLQRGAEGIGKDKDRSTLHRKRRCNPHRQHATSPNFYSIQQSGVIFGQQTTEPQHLLGATKCGKNTRREQDGELEYALLYSLQLCLLPEQYPQLFPRGLQALRK